VPRRTSAIVATIVAVLLLLLWGIVGYGLWRSRVDTLSFAADNTQRLTQLLEGHAARLLDTTRLVLVATKDWFAQHAPLDPRRDPDFAAAAATMIAQTRAISGLSVVGPDGLAHAIVGPPPGMSWFAGDRDYVRVWATPRPYEPYVGSSIRDRADGEWVLPISLANTAAPGAPWIFVVTVRLAHINDLYRSTLVERTDAASLLRTDGTLLTRVPVVESNIGRVFSGGRIFVQHLPHRPRGVFDEVVVIDGTRRLVGYSQVPGTDLLVVFSQETAAALEDWTRSLYLYLTAFGALSAGVILLGVFLVRLIRRDEYYARVQREALLTAEAASRAKSTFLATISHELRTPLNSILGFAGLIADQTLGAIGVAKYREYADDIRHSGRYLLELIEDVLETARIEAGKLTLTPEPVDVCAEIDAALVSVRPEAERKALALDVECPAIPPVEMDRRALLRILINLLGNAVKFTERGRVAVTVTHQAERLSVTVADTGIGIAPEKIALLGRPFVQVDDSLTRRHGGSGLGLAICKGLAEAMGGEIEITSQLGVGTAVTLRLPAPTLRVAAE
jgi:two-component system cell cycle sensor histidine kinase PleC